jgi:hypothetical protein
VEQPNPATKPFSGRDEIILKHNGVYRSECIGAGLVYWMRAMIELAAVLMGLFSAGIFVAHAIDAYQAQ